MTHIVNPSLESYLTHLRPGRDEIFIEIEQLARERKFPAVGPDVGQLLFILARSIGARTILELGSGFGYSALWFGRALDPADPSCKVVCTDTDPENKKQTEAFFRRAGLFGLLEFHVGDALETARRLEGPFDIVFNDVDKEIYPDTIDPAARLVRPGGLFITDNALWYGRVVAPDPDDPKDEATRGVCEFNRRMAKDTRFHTVILPIRDGVSLALRR
jgi:predicted O-methyltransferase YrrM